MPSSFVHTSQKRPKMEDALRKLHVCVLEEVQVLEDHHDLVVTFATSFQLNADTHQVLRLPGNIYQQCLHKDPNAVVIVNQLLRLRSLQSLVAHLQRLASVGPELCANAWNCALWLAALCE